MNTKLQKENLKIQEIKDNLQKNIGRTVTYVSKDFSKDKVNGERKEAIVKILGVYPRFVQVRHIIKNNDLYYDSSILYADILTGRAVIKL